MSRAVQPSHVPSCRHSRPFPPTPSAAGGPAPPSRSTPPGKTDDKLQLDVLAELYWRPSVDPGHAAHAGGVTGFIAIKLAGSAAHIRLQKA